MAIPGDTATPEPLSVGVGASAPAADAGLFGWWRVADAASRRALVAASLGWALDAFLGRITREHGDIDLSVFAPDQRTLFDHLLGGWQMLPHGPSVGQGNAEAWDGCWLEPPSHIHARRDTGEPPPSAIFCNRPFAKYPSHVPSGEKNGDAPPEVPATSVGSACDSGRG